MKIRLIKLIIAITSAAFALSSAAFADAEASSEVQDAVNEIVSYQLAKDEAGSIQEWIDGKLTENAGKSSEWYVMSLSKTGNYDFTRYISALEQYISENEIKSATSRMKLALALISAGGDIKKADEIAENSIGEQGIMSLIYGLHMLNRSCKCSRYTVDSLTDELLSMQFEDGGWAIMGKNGDIDVTAMAVQALAPQYKTNEAVHNAVERAVTFMSEKQQDDGGYISFGTANPESASQVLIALSLIGIDINDSRFVKNGHDVIDGILKFKLPDGSYSHTDGGDTNETATVQAFMAFTEYIIAFSPSDTDVSSVTVLPSYTTAVTSTVVTEQLPEKVSPAAPSWDYKPVLYCVIAAAALTICVILFVLKKRRMSNFVAVFIVAGSFAAFIFFTDFRSSDEYYNSENVHSGSAIGNVSLSIRCDTLVGKSDSEYIPSDGIILDKTDFELYEGQTVYDILTEAVRKFNIQLQSNNGYIAGIGYLYEYDFGDLSGWIYHVNGDTPFVMCTEYELKDGDNIEWLYTCELGNDL